MQCSAIRIVIGARILRSIFCQPLTFFKRSTVYVLSATLTSMRRQGWEIWLMKIWWFPLFTKSAPCKNHVDVVQCLCNISARCIGWSRVYNWRSRDSTNKQLLINRGKRMLPNRRGHGRHGVQCVWKIPDCMYISIMTAHIEWGDWLLITQRRSLLYMTMFAYSSTFKHQ